MDETKREMLVIVPAAPGYEALYIFADGDEVEDVWHSPIVAWVVRRTVHPREFNASEIATFGHVLPDRTVLWGEPVTLHQMNPNHIWDAVKGPDGHIFGLLEPALEWKNESDYINDRRCGPTRNRAASTPEAERKRKLRDADDSGSRH